jgi:hypothetical protein
MPTRKKKRPAHKKKASRRKRTAAKPASKKKPRMRKRRVRKWSGYVTTHSHAMDTEEGIFTSDDPKRIARSLMHSARASHTRKSPPYRSAMSMLTFYINRGGKGMSASRKSILERAKGELRHMHERKTRG